MFLQLSDVKVIQLDHTSRCNLSCAQCARFQYDWTSRPTSKGLDLTVDDYKIILDPFHVKNISLFHCGNFGDAIASPTFMNTFKYCLGKGVKKIKVSTNGSLRNPSWWSQLAKEGGERLTVAFSIDGLTDTNHTYRAGSNWTKIMENVKAFIASGGHAQWDFIEFEHNFHQINDAKQLAKDLGFEMFKVKYTGRFAVTGEKEKRMKSGVMLRDRKSNINQIEISKIEKTYNSFPEYVKQTKIDCKFKSEGKVFIDMNMKLWPCTWLAVFDHFKGPKEHVNGFYKAIQKYGKEFNDLRLHGWKALQHPFFQSYLPNSWDQNENGFERMYACGRTCGEKYEFSSGHGKNKWVNVLK